MGLFPERYTEGLDTLLYPRLCHACLAPLRHADAAPPESQQHVPGLMETGLCLRCASQMRPLEEPYCQRCGDAYESEDGVFLCSNCGDRKFHFAFAFAPFRAEGPLLQLIHRFKYSRELHLSVPLARMIAMGAHEPRVGVFLEENPWVVPVPLHPRREREREYNQAAELGRAFAGQAGLDFAPVLARRRYTVTQTRLGRKERMGNLRDAFSFQPPRRLRAGWPGGRPVLLVDDVLTTGSTASACAKILKASGAPGVVVLTLARG